MPGHGFTDKSFQFLEDLAQNNDRAWFNDHKATFKTYLEEPFLDVLEALTNRLADAPLPLIGSKKTMFRMNRDTRFSEDKSPYKTSVAALLTPSGTKDETGGLVYLHVDATGGMTAAGFYAMTPKRLGPIRDAMVTRADDFDAVLAALADGGRRLEDDDKLTAMPRGYAEQADHRHAEHIKLKSLIVKEDLPKVAWTSGDVVDRVERLARDAAPLLTFAQPG